MISNDVVNKRLQEQALKERMVLDAILILASIEWLQDNLERKILEIDEAENNNKDDDLPKLRLEILSCVRKLDWEIANMDSYMLKYKRLIDEKKELVPCTFKKRPIYLRGVPTNAPREAQGKSMAS